MQKFFIEVGKDVIQLDRFSNFLPIVFILYWFAANRNLTLQNILLVAASYVFYGWRDWRFFILIII